jgi:hypothetical protein
VPLETMTLDFRRIGVVMRALWASGVDSRFSLAEIPPMAAAQVKRSTCLSAPRFTSGHPGASRRLRRHSTFTQPHSRGIPVEKFNALMLKRFAHLIACRSKPAHRLEPARLHVPNRVVADSDFFSESLLIKPKQRSGCPQLISGKIHADSSLLVLHQKCTFGTTPKSDAE